MAIQGLNPYLILDGTAEKAIRHYERALGAKVEGIMRYSEMPGDEKPAPAYADKIIHAALHVGGTMLMVSDAGPGSPVASDTNVHVCLQFEGTDGLAEKFDALAKGGQVTMPLADTFWGARFGMLTDAYGIRWMFNAQLEKSCAA
jgi:PhnB protein